MRFYDFVRIPKDSDYVLINNQIFNGSITVDTDIGEVTNPLHGAALIFCLFLYICHRVSKDGQFQTTMDQLAKKVGMPQWKVKNALIKMTELGIIERESRTRAGLIIKLKNFHRYLDY